MHTSIHTCAAPPQDLGFRRRCATGAATVDFKTKNV